MNDKIRELLPNMKNNSYNGVKPYHAFIKEYADYIKSFDIELSNSLSKKEMKYIDGIVDEVVGKYFKDISIKHNSYVTASMAMNDLIDNGPSYVTMESKIAEYLDGKGAYFISEDARDLSKLKEYKNNTKFSDSTEENENKEHKEQKEQATEKTTEQVSSNNNDKNSNSNSDKKENNKPIVKAEIKEGTIVTVEKEKISTPKKEHEDKLINYKEDQNSDIEIKNPIFVGEIIEDDKIDEDQSINDAIDDAINNATDNIQQEENKWNTDDKKNDLPIISVDEVEEYITQDNNLQDTTDNNGFFVEADVQTTSGSAYTYTRN